MTIGAVSSVNSYYQYSSSVQYNYFSTTVSADRLQDLMKQYGIQQTGDPDADIRALYQVMYSTAAADVQYNTPAKEVKHKEHSQPTEAAASTDVPWATLMNQVGLSATGDLATDYLAFSNKIAVMQASATTPQQKADISQLVAQATIVFVQPESTQAAPQTQTSYQPQKASGADITAMLNRLYTVG